MNILPYERQLTRGKRCQGLADKGECVFLPLIRECDGSHQIRRLQRDPHGIHCNYICPGGVDTPMISRIEQNTFGDTKTHEEAEQIFGAQYLDKRYCRPEEVANLALYLASDVSSHIMGSGIRLDGGMDALC